MVDGQWILALLMVGGIAFVCDVIVTIVGNAINSRMGNNDDQKDQPIGSSEWNMDAPIGSWDNDSWV